MKKLLAIGLVMAVPASAASVVSSPAPVQSSTAAPKWVDAPLTVGGYASLNNGKCCTIVRITDMVISTGPDHQPIWITTFYSDSSGNFPADNQYSRTAERRFSSSDLHGVAMS